jgi:CRP-like cAMP-binding protein
LVAALTSQDFMSLLQRNFDMSVAIMRHLVHIIRTSDQRITDLSTLGVMQRVGRELLRLAEPGPAGAFSIYPLPTQNEIASQIGTTRETVARTLAQFAQDGLIERDGRRLRIPDRTRFEATLAGLSPLSSGD